MATMARITTTRSAAAMMTAAVGLRPKIVVRPVAARGSAEPSSLLRLLLGAGRACGLLRSTSTWPFTSPLGVESDPVPLVDSFELDGAWVPAGGVAVWAAAPITRPPTARTMSRTTARLFMLHLLAPVAATVVPAAQD